MRYYELVRLRKGESIWLDERHIRVDLDQSEPHDAIYDDVAFRDAVADDTFFWVSGGGTLLLNGRYLAVVRRPADARVNANSYSLFTGRSDCRAEHVDPRLTVREMFEELLLFQGSRLLVPQHPALQPLIDGVYRTLVSADIVDSRDALPLPLTSVPLPSRRIEIRADGIENSYDLFLHVNSRNDTNALFLFAASVPITALQAEDGEYSIYDGKVRRAKRSLALLDLETLRITPLDRAMPPGEGHALDESLMTEHLRALVQALGAI